MLKKGLLGVMLVGLLVVPFGIAMADDAPDEVTDAVVVEADRDQVRDQDRDRIQDPTVCGTCEARTDATVAGDRDRDRDQLRDRLHREAPVGLQQQERTCLHGDEGDVQVRERAREHVTMQNGPGEMHQNGSGPQKAGNGYGAGA